MAKMILFLFCISLFCLLEVCDKGGVPSIQPPPGNAALGRIDGVFGYATPSQPPSGEDRDWCLLRFYPDGLVLYTVERTKTKSLTESWPSIGKWFNREKIKLQNTYYVLDNQIWFRTQGRTGNQNYVPVIDWWGTFTDQKMILNSYSHKTNYKRANVEFFRLAIN